VAVTALCLDTSAYSRFKHGEPRCAAVISAATDLALPAIVLGELRVGFELGSRGDRNEAELQRFLAHPFVRVLEVDDGAASLYAEILVELRRAGTPIPTNDIWIAALAAREGAQILTFDRHFELIKRVGVRLLGD
jgi:tRNA(fMet)-specific endonuclease VapC